MNQMDNESIISLGQQVLLLTLTLVSPVLLIGLVIAMITGFFQALMQIQEPTIALVIRLLSMLTALLLLLPWMVQTLISYSTNLIIG